MELATLIRDELAQFLRDADIHCFPAIRNNGIFFSPLDPTNLNSGWKQHDVGSGWIDIYNEYLIVYVNVDDNHGVATIHNTKVLLADPNAFDIIINAIRSSRDQRAT